MAGDGPILIVDDEDDLRDLLDINLRREGFRTACAATAAEALTLAAAERPVLVVLDLMLPDMSGTEVCRRLRASPETAGVPIIMLTAKGEEIDRVVGFEVGADDYVVKSAFSMREFVLRVRAVLRRQASKAEVPDAARLTYGVLEIDEEGHRVYVGGEAIDLTATEFKLLTALARRPGRVQTRGFLLEEVWDLPPDLNTRTVDTHVKRLREKLGAASEHLQTVRGVGYRFAIDPRG
ncbi:MAG: response regulator transcription factor [Alphaproteobacteria bacterium]|nr:response regulator transcription factor [Alphaproteobacteria bacterium]